MKDLAMEMQANSILIIDHRPGIRDLLCQVLQSDGREVRTAASVGEAMEDFEQHVPLVAIVNLDIPGLNLLDLLLEMQERHFVGEAVVLSQYCDTKELLSESWELMVGAQKLGLKYWMVKPFDLDEFQEFIDEALQELEKSGMIR